MKKLYYLLPVLLWIATYFAWVEGAQIIKGNSPVISFWRLFTDLVMVFTSIANINLVRDKNK